MGDKDVEKGVGKKFASMAPGIGSGLGLGATALSGKAMLAGGAALGAGAAAGGLAVRGIGKLVSAWHWILMFLLAIVITFVNATMAHGVIAKLAVYTTFFIAYIWIFKESIDTKNFVKIATFITVLGIFAPTIGNLISEFITISFLAEFLLLLLVFFGYGGPLILMTLVHHEDNAVTRFISFAFVIILIVFVFTSLGDLIMLDNFNAISGVATSQQQEMLTAIGVRIIQGFRAIPGKTVELFTQARNSSTDFVNRTVHYAATGRSFEEEVDSRSGLGSLGFSFSNVRFGVPDDKFLQGRAVSSFVEFQGKTLDIPLEVRLNCVADPSGERIKGEMSKEKVVVHNELKDNLICRFDEDVFVVPKQISLLYTAEFDYSTSAYLKRYFVRATELSRIENPLSHYRIPSSEESSVFTSGPVKITINTHNLVQPVNVGNTEFGLNVEITNNVRHPFTGNIKEISRIIISLPKSIEIKRSRTGLECVGSIKEQREDECLNLCEYADEICSHDCRNNNNYYYDIDDLNNIYMKNERGNKFIQTPIVVSCVLNIPREQNIMRDSPIAIENFRVKTEYTYFTSISRNFEITRDTNYIVPGFDEQLISSTYTRYWETSSGQEVSGIMSRNQEVANDVKEIASGLNINDRGWVSLLKAIGVFIWRGSDPNYQNYDGNKYIFGVVDRKIDAPIGTRVTDRESELNYVYRYLVFQMQNECQRIVAGKEIGDLDCAISKFMGNEDFTRHIIAIARDYKNG